MRIEEELKLDFKDVLFRPKRSTCSARAPRWNKRTYKYRHSGRSSESVPIIAANMDTVGTFEMAVALAKHEMHVALHKHYRWRTTSPSSTITTIRCTATRSIHWGITDPDPKIPRGTQRHRQQHRVCLHRRCQWLHRDISRLRQSAFASLTRPLRSWPAVW